MPPPNPSGASRWREIARTQPPTWLVFGLIYFALDRGRQGTDVGTAEQLYLLVRAAAWASTGAMVSAGLALLYGQIPRARSRVVAAVVGLPIGAAVWFLVFQTLDALPGGLEDGFDPPWMWGLDHLFAEYTDHFLSLGAWTGLVFSMAARSRASEAQLRAARAEAAAHGAQLDALRHQLSPHFLFNSLNTSIALVSQDPDQAEEVLTELARLLRDSLQLDIADVHPLRQELALTRRYLGIARVRFADDLEVEEEVTRDALDFPVPVFSLQSVVDNALKHGMKTSPMPLRVRIEAALDPAGLQLRVTNTGKLGTASEGRGLTILRTQLKTVDGSVALETGPHTVTCTLRVPA